MNDGLTEEKIGVEHHAYAIAGGRGTRNILFKILEESWKVATTGNPNFFHQNIQTLSVDEARELKNRQANKAIGEGKKIFVIETDSITVPAQNSLLKILEEPTKDTYFFFIGDCTRNLIPTLDSRLFKISAEQGTPSISKNAEAFLKSSRAERLLIVKKIVDDIKDEKTTKAEARHLIEEIENTLYKKARLNGKPSEAMFRSLEMCRGYASDPSASVKMLLEYVALVIPEE